MKLYYSLLLKSVVLLLILFTSCSEQKKVEKINEEVASTLAATEFMKSIFYQDFFSANKHCNNASKVFVKKLEQYGWMFRNVYFVTVDTCVVNKNEAECTCEYQNTDGETYQQTLSMIKYEEGWKANFLLGTNFDNIFLYDYSNKQFYGDGKWNHLSFSPALSLEIEKALKTLNSNNLVVNHTTLYDVYVGDSLASGEAESFKSSKILLDGFQLGKQYNLENNVLTSVVFNLQNYEMMDMQFYYKTCVEMLMKEFGHPFNIKPSDVTAGYHNFHALRWFLKNRNEILELRFSTGVFTLTLNAAV